MKKRVISLILSVLMIVSMFTNIPLKTFAVTYDANEVVDLALSKVGTNFANGYCLKFVRLMFNEAYGFNSSACCAYKYGNSYIDSTSRNNIPLGASVFFGGSSLTCSTCGNKCGHIGIYVGDDYIVHGWSGKIVKYKIDRVINAGYPYRGWGWHGNVELTSATVEPEPIEPSLSVSKSNVSLGTINNTSATFTVTCEGDWSRLGWTNSSSVYGISNTAQNGNVLTFKVNAKAAGSDKISFSLYDANENVVATKIVSVTVAGPTLSASTSNVSLNLTGSNSSTVTLTAGGDLPSSYYINYGTTNGNVSLSFGDWSGKSIPMTVKGLKTGSDTITLKLKNSNNDAVIATKTISVSVTGTTYTVTYNANGGSGAPSAQTKLYGTDVTLSSAVPTGKSYTVTFNGNGGTVAKSSQTYTQTFQNWNTKADGTGTNYWPSGNYSSNSSVTMYAKWSTPTLKVENPTRSNYYFAGWYDSKETNSHGLPTGKKYTAGTPITSNLTLYAMWSTNMDMTVFFGDYNLDGSIDFISDVVAVSNMANGIITYTDEDAFRCDVNADGKITSDDMTLLNNVRNGATNMYTMPCYLYYDGLVVKKSPNKTTYQYGEDFDVSGLVLEAQYSNGITHTLSNGYIVTGYDPYKIGKQQLTVNYYFDSTTLSVTVEAPKYALRYDANGGQVSTSGKTVTYGSSIGTLPTPTRDGYTFLGWSYSTSGTTYVNSSTTYSYMSDKTLYAQWSRKTYTISYNANGGSNAPSSQTATHGNEYVVDLSTTPYRNGYTFLGWSSKSTATAATYLPGDKITVNESIVLYAIWEKAEQLKTNDLVESTLKFSGQETIYEFTPTQTGEYRVFVNSDSVWSITLPFGDSSISNNTYLSCDYEPIFVELVANKKYYIKITPEDYGLTTANFSVGVEKKLVEYTLTLNDPIGSTNEKIYLFENESLTLPKYEKTGYEFLGWSTTNSATDVTYQSGESITINNDLTLYAVWEEQANVLLGDINGDGAVDAGDAVIISRYDAGFVTLTQEQLVVGDVNGDGAVDAGDAVIISRFDAGLISQIGY